MKELYTSLTQTFATIYHRFIAYTVAVTKALFFVLLIFIAQLRN